MTYVTAFRYKKILEIDHFIQISLAKVKWFEDFAESKQVAIQEAIEAEEEKWANRYVTLQVAMVQINQFHLWQPLHAQHAKHEAGVGE